jgi:hypothetical protein
MNKGLGKEDRKKLIKCIQSKDEGAIQNILGDLDPYTLFNIYDFKSKDVIDSWNISERSGNYKPTEEMEYPPKVIIALPDNGRGRSDGE